jgi:hypothetical protein
MASFLDIQGDPVKHESRVLLVARCFIMPTMRQQNSGAKCGPFIGQAHAVERANRRDTLPGCEDPGLRNICNDIDQTPLERAAKRSRSNFSDHGRYRALI